MNGFENKILAFADQINRYGHAVIISAKVGNMETSIEGKYTPIDVLTNGTPLFVYLKEIIENLNVDQLIVVAKQKNGINAYKNPKTFVLDLVKKEIPEQNISYSPVTVGHGASGLIGVHNSHVPQDPMNQVLNFKIEQQHQQINELKPYKEKYEEEREKRFDVERELKLIKEQHELEKAKEEYESKNSVSGVISELKVPIANALAGLAGNMQGEQVEALGNVGTSNPKISFLVELFNEMDNEIIDSLFEINTRLIYVNPIIKPVLDTVRKNTEQLDQQIEEIKNKYN